VSSPCGIVGQFTDVRRESLAGLQPADENGSAAPILEAEVMLACRV
jgi:hypothetical protein